MEASPIDALIAHSVNKTSARRISEWLALHGLSVELQPVREDTPKASEIERLLDRSPVLVAMPLEAPGASLMRLFAARAQERKIPVLCVGGEGPDARKAAFGLLGPPTVQARYVAMTFSDPLQGQLIQLRDQILVAVRGLDEAVDHALQALMHGTEAERREAWETALASDFDRAAFGARLRNELELDAIAAPFGAHKESASRLTSAARGWLLSMLAQIETDPKLVAPWLLRHIDPAFELDGDVRYWAAAAVTFRPWLLAERARLATREPRRDVALLLGGAQALRGADGELALRAMLQDDSEEAREQALRVLRIVPVPGLTPVLVEQLRRPDEGADTLQVFHALNHPEVIAAARPLLLADPGVEAVRVRLEAATEDDPSAQSPFDALLEALEHAPAVAPDAASSTAPAVSGPAAPGADPDAPGGLSAATAVDDTLSVAGYSADSVKDEVDALGVSAEAQTLTAIAMARDLKPPLAIGLFGDWGAGKSFFMHQMQKTAQGLAERARSQGPESRFCQHVVQVEFNAWHYVDANLWASLVSYILEKLAAHVSPSTSPAAQQAALLAQLDSARGAIQTAELAHAQARAQCEAETAKLARLQGDRAAAQIRLARLRPDDLVALLGGETQLRAQIQDAASTLGLTDTVSTLADLRRAGVGAAALSHRATTLLSVMVKDRRLLPYMLVALAGLSTLAWLPELLHVYGDRLQPGIALLVKAGAVLAPLLAWWNKGVKTITRSLDMLKTAQAQVDEVVARQREDVGEDEQTLEATVRRFEAEERAAAERVSQAAQRAQELDARVHELRDSQSLSRFLAERTGSSDYRQHLGLVSTVRRDFETLAEKLSAGQAETKGMVPVERIILYIDDLDRCPASTVVQVLQAVHLLLAFPLFVVVVGVDSRWLVRALASHYKELGGSGDGDAATPHQYLEKIFQIPFALKPMDADGYLRLVGRLMNPASPPPVATPGSALGSGSAAPGESADPPDIPEAAPAQSSAPDGAPALAPPPTAAVASMEDVPRAASADAGNGGATGAPADSSPGVTQDIPSVAPLPDGPSPPSTLPAAPAFRFEIGESALVLQPWEVAYAESLHPFIGSPRAVKRLVNVYRVLKAGVAPRSLRAFEGGAAQPGEFQVPLLLLALLVGNAMEAEGSFEALLQAATRAESVGGTVGQAVGETVDHFASSPDLAGAMARLLDYVGRPGFPQNPTLLRQWIPRVARFSFNLTRGVGTGRFAQPPRPQPGPSAA